MNKTHQMCSGIQVTCSFMMNCDAIILTHVCNWFTHLQPEWQTTSYWQSYFYSVVVSFSFTAQIFHYHIIVAVFQYLYIILGISLWYGTVEAAYMHFLVTDWQICKCFIYISYLLRPQEIVGVFQLSGVIAMYIHENMRFLVNKLSWVLLLLVQCF